MASNLKYKASYCFTKIHKESKKTKYNNGAIENGLSPNLTKKFLKGASITNEMINREIEKHKDIKRTIKQLKKDLQELKINKGKFFKYKKI